jgi:hypothetical protein
MVQLDVDHVYTTAGGIKGLVELLLRHGQDEGLNYPMVQMWRQRGRIPREWQIPVLYALRCEGHEPLSFMVDSLLVPA